METPAESYRVDEFTLARWRFADGPELTATVAGSLEHIGAWMIWAAGGYTADDSAEFLKRTNENWESGETHDFAIRVGGEIAGAIGMMTRDGGIEIGYWLALGHTGRGLITRAAGFLTAEAFRLGAGYVEIKHDELNVRSGAVPARLGFTEVRSEPAEKPLAPSCSGTNHVWRKEKP
ncbi:GNAT family N-acetyltransferase [Amycolatopsis solani]|uniref:GNAT family N-acetyltransferase n=1 Tax=Amycolatopsis solani TaxID=3028615 RepID=UPI0025B04F0C|nr:GNAT family N-acetyltransferase [Amycolatopsis sp. MEP2-6]